MNKMALLIPVFLLLVATEWWFSRKRKPNYITGKNTMLNMTIGAVDQLVAIVNFALFVWVLKIVYDSFRIFTLGNEWYIWVLAYFAVDFISYWYHRFSHRIALLWCGHVTHHSSDHFNLSNGFRTSPFQGLNRIPFWLILPILGFSPEMLFAVFIVSGLYDFFLHTENFPRARWLETVFITPSLHSVHHGKNDIYIDKNYGATFSFWDRMFGTFQEKTEKVEYGIISQDFKDGDPVDAIFHHYIYLWKLIKNTKSWKNRIMVLIMPPDYLPDDIELNLTNPDFENPDHSIGRYGFWLFIVSTCGVLAVLLFQDLLNLWAFVYFAICGVSGMVVGARIFHSRTGLNFRRNEMLRLIILAAAGLVLLFFEQPYFAVLLTTSILLLLVALILGFRNYLRLFNSPIT